jgi:signal transduction histidine kinase/HD-like signal output (HDOD) protein
MSSMPDARRRVELILEQLDQLPTLSSVALRLLEVTSSDDSSAEDVIELVSADPALSARLLAMCRRAHLGVSLEGADVAHAVKLLGFDEVRAAAASVQVFELLEGLSSRGGEVRVGASIFRPADFWIHSIAAAILSERLARMPAIRREVRPGDAFLAGLMHDLGHLALHTILPRSFDRACELSDADGCGLDEACVSIIGIDAHSVGRHLAQHWLLPPALVEVIWLNGAPSEAIASSSHAPLLRVVTLADILARRRLLTHAGHDIEHPDAVGGGSPFDLSAETLERICDGIHEEVAERALSLGLGGGADIDVLRRSFERATHLLGRMRRARKEGQDGADRAAQTLRAVGDLLAAAAPGASLTTVASAIARSASTMTGAPPVALVVASSGRAGELFRFRDAHANAGMSATQSAHSSEAAPFPASAHILDDSSSEIELSPEAIALRLPGSDDVSATLLVSNDAGPAFRDDRCRELLCRLWGGAISGATLNERLVDLGHRLVEANRRLVAAQDSLSAQRAAAATAELACGAAHEMNNPLTVISARAQQLAAKLEQGPLRDAAAAIVLEAHAISDLISALQLAARAPEPNPSIVQVSDILRDAVRLFEERGPVTAAISLRIDDSLPVARVDRPQLAQAIRELLQNAQEARADAEIVVRAEITRRDDRLIISAADNGPGLTPRALEHAFDPFFSEKPAGRRPGLGLARARRLVEANHGRLTLRNGPDGGAVASIILARWRADESETRQAA